MKMIRMSVRVFCLIARKAVTANFFSSVVLHAPASMNSYLLTGLGVASNKNIRYAVGEGDVVFNTDPSMVGEVRERCLIPARGGSDG
jgi:hypothetical protein